MSDREIKHGLCDWCALELYAATWGQVQRKNVRGSKMTKDEVTSAMKYNREMGEAAGDEYDRLAKEAKTNCVIMASFFDDFAPRGDGLEEALMCKRHLQEALDLLS